MPKFMLAPCRIRGTKVAKVRDAELMEKDWPGICELLKPEDPTSAELLRNFRFARPGAFVGTVSGKRTGKLVPFVMRTPDGKANLEWLQKQDPGAIDRIHCIYLVESVEWEATVQETGVGPRP